MVCVTTYATWLKQPMLYALENKMGVASHMVSLRDGEVEDSDDTKQCYIQETAVANICKVNQVQQRCVEYDFMDIFKSLRSSTGFKVILEGSTQLPKRST